MSVTTVDFSAGGQSCRALVPDNYVTGGNLVQYHHGAGESQGITTAGDTNIAQMCADGYIVAASNAAGDNWGNQAALDAYLAMQVYLIANYMPGATAIYSKSMGGLSGLLTVAARQITALCGWVGVYPACSLSNMFNGNSGTYAPDIRVAHTIAADGSDYAAKTAGHDPLIVATSSFAGIPMRFYASAADTVVDKTANSDAFASHVASVAPEFTVIVCSGNHGDASHYQPSDVSAFLARTFARRAFKGLRALRQS